jgi:hypothetical protein
MDIPLSLGYGIAIYVALMVVSIPFGFVIGFNQARNNSLSNSMQLWLKRTEYLAEAFILILITIHLYHSASHGLFLTVLGAYVLANAIAYLVEIRFMKESLRTFSCRAFVALFVCLPVGFYFASAT